MDDISYRISKSHSSNIKQKILMNLEASSEMYGDANEFLSEPETATAVVMGGGIGESKD